MTELRFSELSALRQALIRRCQRMGFGKILRLDVRDGQPVFAPGTEVLLDVKLPDFVLCAAVGRFVEQLDSIGDGTVEQIEVRAGIPVRMFFKASVNL
jgi:hypothetical protein